MRQNVPKTPNRLEVCLTHFPLPQPHLTGQPSKDRIKLIQDEVKELSLHPLHLSSPFLIFKDLLEQLVSPTPSPSQPSQTETPSNISQPQDFGEASATSVYVVYRSIADENVSGCILVH